MAVKNLYEYYQGQGKPLPSVSERMPIAEQYGIKDYTGSAEQNELLLSKLQGSGAPGDLPPVGGDAPEEGSGGAKKTGGLSSLRLALRMAAEEGGKARSAAALNQFGAAGLGRTPGTLGSIADIVRGSVKPDVKSIFGDVMQGVKDENEARQKELDRINELRLEFGSLVPANVTDLETALNLIAPTVDAERKAKLEKLKADQASDNDVESWAESFAKGEVAIGNVPAAIRTQVKVRADDIRAQLETEAKTEYQNKIAFRIERKTSDFDTERALVSQDDNLTTEEQRDMIDYIDGLEAAQKANKTKGTKAPIIPAMTYDPKTNSLIPAPKVTDPKQFFTGVK